MKTAITVLQEMMIKLGETPEYECISQSGPHHQALFEYRCAARGLVANAVARSKKEAKQEAARALLLKLAASGEPVPPPFGSHNPPLFGSHNPPPFGSQHPPPFGSQHPPTEAAGGGAGGADVRSYVALLRELCEEYKLPGVEYELVGDTGPPHLRHFTVRATISQHARLATATTKKAARQAAAEALYHYLRDNLKLTRDFVEEEALVRAHEKAMERYCETREEQLQRPLLSQRPADYHIGLLQEFEESLRSLALEALESTAAARQGGEVRLACAAAALRLEPAWAELPPLHVVSLPTAAPPLAFAARTRARAAARAADHLHRTLRAVAPPPPTAAAAAASIP